MQTNVELGVEMFRDKQLSISAAAKIAGKPLSEMLTLVSKMGIPVVDYTQEDAEFEARLAEEWIKEQTNTQLP
jgi:predicted HTH domain antitoxin